MKLLITGVTGLIGNHIRELCREKKIDINYLTTSRDKIESTSGYHGFYWNPKTGEIDKNCLEDVDKIIHLAGASVAQRWTKKHRKDILDSRIDTANLLFKLLSENKNHITQFISASAIGIYPNSISHLYDEDSDEVGKDFLSEVVQKWETAADQFKNLGLEVTKVRIGLVLAEKGGILAEIKKPIQNYVGAPLGNGNQWQSWIHISDLARLFVFVAEEEHSGIFNAVAPQPVKQKNLIKCVAEHLNKPILFPKVPGFILKIVLGEMATMILASQLVVSKRLEPLGFTFHFHHLENAVKDLV